MLSNYTLYNKLLMLFLLMSSTFLAFSQESDPYVGYKIKHLANFANYTTWPTNARTIFKVGVIDSKEYYDLIKTFYEGKRIKDKLVEVILFSDIQTDLDCDLLYIPATFHETSLLFKYTRGKPILIVGDRHKGEEVLINFSILEGEIIYEINPNAYHKANLQVDYYFEKTSRIFRE